MNFKEHLKLFNIFRFNNFDEIEDFSLNSNWSEPTDEEIKFLNHREMADPSSSFKDNLRFYSALGKSGLLQSAILSERYGSYESTSSFVLENLHGTKKVLEWMADQNQTISTVKKSFSSKSAAAIPSRIARYSAPAEMIVSLELPPIP